MKRSIIRAAVGLLWLSATADAQLSNLAGTWILNTERSRWGRMQQPQNVIIEIEHKEPALRYCGTVTYANEDVRPFCFEGAVDGRPYAVERSFGPGTATVKRVDGFSIVSTYTSTDGQYSETSTTTVSRDGKRLTRRLHLRSPVGVRTWTEEYDKH